MLFMVMQVTSCRPGYQIDCSRQLTTKLLSFATDMVQTAVAASVPLWICLLAAATPEIVLQVQPYHIIYLMSLQHLCTLATMTCLDCSCYMPCRGLVLCLVRLRQLQSCLEYS